MLISKDTPTEKALELGKIECKGCVHCCSYGSGFLVGDDKERIAKFLRITPEQLKKKFLEEVEKFHTKLHRPKIVQQKDRPYGSCVFLNKNFGCTIHEVKPLHCKIGNCADHSTDLQKWFDLKHFVNPDDPESIRQYSVWLEFNEPIPGGDLEVLVPNKEKLRRMLSYEKM
ncbi:MAG: YkgJ family cysteine cluster protein [bacterium]|nr:YkgJ family cysteine cluster protein [bacterium]